MKKFFSIIILITLALSLHVFVRDKNTIVVYYCMEEHRGQEMQKQLNNAFPHLDITCIYGSTSKTATKISVEGKGTDADIVVGLESSYMYSFLDALRDPTEFSNIDYLDGLEISDNKNKFVTWERGSASFIINKDYFDKNNIPYPKSYDDLLDPKFKNMIAMPDPKMSNTGYSVYKNLINEYGEKGALEYFDKLSKNIKQFTESGSGPTKMLMQGEINIAIGLTFMGVDMINQGFNVEIISPDIGTPYNLTATGLIDKPHNKNIEDVFRYIVNDFMIYDKTYLCPEIVYHGQVNKIENYPQNIVYGNMDGVDNLVEKERLLGLWKY